MSVSKSTFFSELNVVFVVLLILQNKFWSDDSQMI